jgi:2-dehydropantoate 2-reductase
MRILIVGAGAVGGYFGARLVQAERDVTFLVRPRRADQIKTSGLRIISPSGDFTVTPRLVEPGKINSTFDVVLLAVKAFGLQQAMHDFAPAIGGKTMIVPFLNGLRHLESLTTQFGAEPVLGGVCLVATTIKEDGSIAQLDGIQSLSYGELTGDATTRVGKLDQVLKGAGFDAVSSRNIMQEMWEKWIFLATLGGITCVLRGTIGEIENAPGGTDLALQLLAECAAVSTAFGHTHRPLLSPASRPQLRRRVQV